MLSKNPLGSEDFKDQNSIHNFVCTICCSVPHPDIAFELTECGHIFCEECLNRLIKAAQACPNCKRPIGSSYRSLKTGSKAAYRLLMDLTVKCTKQCSWSGAWSSLDEHLAKCKGPPPNNYGSLHSQPKGIPTERKNHGRSQPENHMGRVESLRWLTPESDHRMAQSVVSEERKNPPPVQKKPLVLVLNTKYNASVHSHPLTYIKKKGWACNKVSISGGCKSNFRPGKFIQTEDEPRFRCSDCNYNLCVKCLEAYLI